MSSLPPTVNGRALRRARHSLRRRGRKSDALRAHAAAETGSALTAQYCIALWIDVFSTLTPSGASVRAFVDARLVRLTLPKGLPTAAVKRSRDAHSVALKADR